MRAGDPVYVADGTIALVATDVRRDCVTCRVRVGGTLRSRKGINLPNDIVAARADRQGPRRSGGHQVLAPDFIGISYVRHERDLALARELTDLPLVAKIEKQQALERLDAIAASADAIMVARGDLGVEIPIERVPATQKRIIRAANRAGCPVITATQMLMSMVTNPLPTRAEVTDVANAVIDGTDAVMLSEETAVGHDPLGAVQMMNRLLVETEPLLPAHEGPDRASEANALAQPSPRWRTTSAPQRSSSPPAPASAPGAWRLSTAPADPGLQPRARRRRAGCTSCGACAPSTWSCPPGWIPCARRWTPPAAISARDHA